MLQKEVQFYGFILEENKIKLKLCYISILFLVSYVIWLSLFDLLLLKLLIVLHE